LFHNRLPDGAAWRLVYAQCPKLQNISRSHSADSAMSHMISRGEWPVQNRVHYTNTADCKVYLVQYMFNLQTCIVDNQV